MHRFGDVVVDPRAREVRRRGDLAHLEPQAFDLLVHLIERREEVVSKHDLLDGVWGHRFVSEAALTTRIKEIRRAVGDDGATQHTIRNVRGRGYRFVAELDETATVSRAASAARRGGHALVGRDAELAGVVERLHVAPVVTLVGPGGVGKSTLARAVLRRLAGGATDGAHLVELAPLDRGDRVLPTVARALDTQFDPTRPELVIATLARLDALLVLDNCEHVVDDVADLVDRIVATPERTARVLCTSQVRLGVTGEYVIGLTPLTPDAAAALFTERAQEVRPGWSAAAVPADRLAALLDHLDRLPLTIEMAAGRLASMTFDDLETAVLRDGQLVQLSHRTPTRRHRTLSSLVEWSADLLAPEHRRTFEELSVFAGGVAAADVGAVLGPGAGPSLVELTERSLLAVDLGGATARYRMLDTVRTVALGWLSARGGAADAHRRHAHAYADALERADEALRTTDESSGRRRLAEITDELRHAHRWAREHDADLADRISGSLHLAAYNRLWAEPPMWAAELLARPERAVGDDPLLPGSRILVAGAAANAGDLARARAEAERVLTSAASPLLAAAAHDVLSDVALYGGRLDDVEHHAAELLAIGTDLADPHIVTLATVNRSLLRTFSGDAADGLAVLLPSDDAAMSRSSLAWRAYAAGEAHAQLGASDRAVEAFGRAIDLGASVDNPFVTSVARSALAAELARAGSARAAYEAYAAGLRSAVRHGNLVHAWTMVRNLVALLHADGDQRAAVVLATATQRRPAPAPYASGAADITAVVDEIESATWPDRFRAWVDEGEALDPDAAVRRAISIVEQHAR